MRTADVVEKLTQEVFGASAVTSVDNAATDPSTDPSRLPAPADRCWTVRVWGREGEILMSSDTLTKRAAFEDIKEKLERRLFLGESD